MSQLESFLAAESRALVEERAHVEIIKGGGVNWENLIGLNCLGFYTFLLPIIIVQWNLSTTDKLGIGPLSLVERLSPSRRLSLYHYCITK